MGQNFNGTTDLHDELGVPQIGNGTFAFWIIPDSLPSSTERDIVLTFYEQAESEQFSTHDKQIFINSSGIIKSRIYDGAVKLVASTSTLSVGVKTFVCVTIDGSDLKIYIAGSNEGTTAAGTSFTGYSNPALRLAGLPNSVDDSESSRARFNATIGNFGLWSRVLNSTEISNLAAGTLPSTLSTNLELALYEDPAVSNPAPLFRGRNFPFFDDEEVNRFEFWSAIVVSGDVSVNLTGVSTTGNIGTIGVDRTSAISGEGSTVSLGSLTVNTSINITGEQSTSAIRSFVVTSDVGLSSVISTAAVNAPSISIDIGLGGVSLTGAVGTVTASIGGDVSVVLTGVSSSGAVGALLPSVDLALSGLSVAVAIGSLTPEFGVPCVGIESTGLAGTLQPTTTVSISGQVATGEAGSLGVDAAPWLSGIAITGNVGSLSVSASVGLSGTASTAAVGSVATGPPIVSGKVITVVPVDNRIIQAKADRRVAIVPAEQRTTNAGGE